MNTSKIHSIIFDFGGVLLDWNPHNLYRRFFNTPQEIDQFLMEISFPEWNLQQDKGRPFAQGVAELSEKFPQYSNLIRAYREQWEESIVGPIDGSVAILRRLKNAGFSVYGLSNWSAETFPIAYKKYDFFKLFDGIVISGIVKVAKPDPAIFELILKMINRPSSECLLIDDSALNVTAAQRLGFAAIQFETPEKLELELQKNGIIMTTKFGGKRLYDP
jgi:2-haloacid dehalogenase